MGRLQYKVDRRPVGECDIKIYKYDDKHIVIVTELDDNPGPSITNVAAELANLVWQEFKLDVNKLMWIENYRWPRDIHYDLVSFDIVDGFLANPRWSPFKAEDVKTIQEDAIW